MEACWVHINVNGCWRTALRHLLFGEAIGGRGATQAWGHSTEKETGPGHPATLSDKPKYMQNQEGRKVKT